MEGSVIVLDSSDILRMFGLIINVLLIKFDEPYFVNYWKLRDFPLTFTVMLYGEPSQFPLHSASQMNYQIIIF